ncbi:MAG TPA: vWA domain-containing protein [Polyangiaceae bacterium]|nr:vWA domain-containing protein [Polyangiaceae bacterium]
MLDPQLQPMQTNGCVDITRNYDSEPPTLLLLIDQSQSMSFAFGDSTRWDVLRQAIVDPDQGLLTALDQSARIGLMIFTGRGGFANPLGCPLLTTVPIQFGDVDLVRSTYLAASPALGGDTPTGESIDQAAAALTAIQSRAPKYILLATDGVPDTCAQPQLKQGQGLPQALDAAQRAFSQGIRMYTLGVSDSVGLQNLQQLANAGAGKDPSLVFGTDADAEQPLSASSDPRQLANQLNGIIGDVRTCTVALGTTVGTRGALEGNIVLDGQPLDDDPQNGWTLVDNQTLLIHGTACQKILSDGQQLQVTFPCASNFTPR